MAPTDTACRNAKPGDRPRKLADEKGLYLLVNAPGKYWRWGLLTCQRRRWNCGGTSPDVSITEVAPPMDRDATRNLNAELLASARALRARC
ncbi:MAG: Arm DNA-binding domain-containing protein [Burkholderiaceae bacterium]